MGVSERRSNPRTRAQSAQIGTRNGSKTQDVTERRSREGGALWYENFLPRVNARGRGRQLTIIVGASVTATANDLFTCHLSWLTIVITSRGVRSPSLQLSIVQK